MGIAFVNGCPNHTLYKKNNDAANIPAIELVVDVECLNPVEQSRNWHTRSSDTCVARIQHVVCPKVELLLEDTGVKLPLTCKQNLARKLGANCISDLSH